MKGMMECPGMQNRNRPISQAIDATLQQMVELVSNEERKRRRPWQWVPANSA